MDSQSVKTTEESGGIKGYDGGKQVKGRKRHVLVDTLRLLLAVEVTPANISDQAGTRRLLIGLKPLQPRLELSWADGSYSGEPLAPWCAAAGAWRVEIITPTPYVQGFAVRPWCWSVERPLGWLGRQRRLSKDYERKVQTSETLLKLAMIRLMVRRLAGSTTWFSKHALSALRWWAEKIGRPWVLESTNTVYGIPARRTVATASKARVLEAEKLAAIRDPYVRLSLELQRAFGLRREESVRRCALV
jgi:transposase